MSKQYLMSCLTFLVVNLFSHEELSLPFYKETEHFRAYCLTDDAEATEAILLDLEPYYQKCSQDFSCTPHISEKIRLNIYPDIQAFHATLNEKVLSQWKVCKFSYADNGISLVTPKNPGTIHTEETIKKCARHTLGLFFVRSKSNHSSSWLSHGLALYESKVYSWALVAQHLLNAYGEVVMPSCSQIDEQIRNGEFTFRAYPIAAYVYVDFLVKNWGWDKALDLLEDGATFETVLQVSEEEFQKSCVQYYQEHLSSINK